MTVPRPFGVERTYTILSAPPGSAAAAGDDSGFRGQQEKLNAEIRFEQLSQALSGSIYSIVLEALAAAFLTIGLSAKLATGWLATWLLLVWGLSALRTLLWYRHRGWFINTETLDLAQALLLGASIASGLLWGGAMAFLWPHGDTTFQVFLIMTAASMAAASSGFLLSHMPSLVAFIGVGLVMVMAGYFRNGDETLYSVITGFAIPYALILSLVARHINAILRKSHMLRLELAGAKEEAQVASRAKSEFISSISHELRTPLNAIIGFSEIMMQQMFGPMANAQYLDYAKDIHRSGTHLLAIINDILDLTKIEAGKMMVHEELVDVAEVVAATVSIVRDSADKAGLSLECRCPDPTPRLRCDERLLKQMLLNLLSNAIKFTPIGGKVAIEALRQPEGDTVIRVSDTGIGIAPEHIELVMQAFGQVEGAMTRQHSGTGLGLPLVKAMADLHDADFRIQSEIDRGTTAELHFPAARSV